MIFEILSTAAERGELILVDGGLCHWHIRRDGQLTIREILVLPEYRGRGIGTGMLDMLKAIPGVQSIFVKCPEELAANEWYHRRGFEDEGMETTRTGRRLKRWRCRL